MRLIDADAFIAKLNHVPMVQEAIRKAMDTMPTIEERKKGEWIDMGDFEQCSVCTGTHLKTVNTVYGKAIWIKSAYCPNCGADMRGEQG